MPPDGLSVGVGGGDDGVGDGDDGVGDGFGLVVVGPGLGFFVLLALGEGEGLGDGEAEREYLRSHCRQTGGVVGLGKSLMGRPAWAAFMKVAQMMVLHSPPQATRPWMRPIGVFSFAYPIHTAVASCGVYPQNQASAWLSVVPVLPAAGRPMKPLGYAVPPVMTPLSACVTQ